MISPSKWPGTRLDEKIPDDFLKLLEEVQTWPYFTLEEYDEKAKYLSGLEFVIIHESLVYKDGKPIPNEKLIRYTLCHNMRTDYPGERRIECALKIFWTLQKTCMQNHTSWSRLYGLMNYLTSEELKLHIFKDHKIYPIPEDLSERIISESYNLK